MAVETASQGVRSRQVRVPVYITGGVTAAGTVLFWFFLVNPWNFAYGSRVASVAVGVTVAGGTLLASLPLRRRIARRVVAIAGGSVALVLSVPFFLMSLWSASDEGTSRVVDVSPDGETRLVLVVRDGFSKNSSAEVELQSGSKPFHQEASVFYTNSMGAPHRIRFIGPHTIEIALTSGSHPRRIQYDPDTLDAGRFMPD